MSTDRYQQFTQTPPGRFLASRVGLPRPVTLRRYTPGAALIDGAVALGAAPGARALTAVATELAAITPAVQAHAPADDVRKQVEGVGLTATAGADRLGAVIFDATGIADVPGLRALYEFLHPLARSLRPCGRVIVIGAPPQDAQTPGARAAQRALEGFTRSLAKEVGSGSTAQLVYVQTGAEGALASTLRFLLSGQSAYVSGQVIRVSAPAAAVAAPQDWARPLAGRTALVTGASRGIGEAIVQTLARDGATLICLDVPAAGDALAAVANEAGGSALTLDITDEQAPARIVEHVKERHNGLDIVVHNAGITRDKTLGRMSPDQWDSVLSVNLHAPQRITDALLDAGALNDQARVVCVSSMSGIAGNRGQTNYAASKAGLIGLVDALAPRLAEVPATINAVAPGFIETRMTAAMPAATREVGRRMNSLAQGGQPIDVAETIAYFASPASAGLNGNTLRVCGQNLLGA